VREKNVYFLRGFFLLFSLINLVSDFVHDLDLCLDLDLVLQQVIYYHLVGTLF